MEATLGRKKAIVQSLIAIPEITILLPVGLLIVLGTAVSREFLTFSNLLSMIRNASYVGMVAIFMTLLLMSKGLDLSCDAVAALSSILFGFTLQLLNFGPALSIVLAIAV